MAELSVQKSGRWRVVFTTDERRELYEKAVARNHRWHGRNVRAEWYGMDGLEANYIGVLGEAAFAVYLGLDLDFVQVYDQKGDDGNDFSTEAGTAQVKCTRRFEAPRLVVGEWEKVESEYFVLAAYDKKSRNTVDLVGAVSKKRLMEQPLVEMYEKNVRCLEADQLTALGHRSNEKSVPMADEEMTVEYWLREIPKRIGVIE